jgi:hypothetical protein
MVQKYFIESWLLPCSLRSLRIANPTPQNGLRHFSALPTYHPTSGWQSVQENFAQLDKPEKSDNFTHLQIFFSFSKNKP